MHYNCYLEIETISESVIEHGNVVVPFVSPEIKNVITKPLTPFCIIVEPVDTTITFLLLI